jgi:hypothetical protein
MSREVDGILASKKAIHSGADYNDPAFEPIGKWKNVGEKKNDQESGYALSRRRARTYSQ